MFIEKRIQKTGTIFPRNNRNTNSWYEAPPLGYSYLNLWAINNILGDYSQEMVDKTIYDPYPAGFTITGENSEDSSKSAEWNVDDTSEKGFEQNWGFNFQTNKSKTTTIHFPVTGDRYSNDGAMQSSGQGGFYQSVFLLGCVETGKSADRNFEFFKGYKVMPKFCTNCPYGFAARPIAE